MIKYLTRWYNKKMWVFPEKAKIYWGLYIKDPSKGNPPY